MKKISIILFICFLIGETIYAQEESLQLPTSQAELNVNNIRTRILNGGDMFWDLSDARFEVPKVSKDSNPRPSRHTVFCAALWMGGIDENGALRAAAQTYRQSGNAFYPGPLDENSNISRQESKEWNKIWRTERDQIQAFLRDWADGELNNEVPPQVLDYPAKGNPYLLGSFNSALKIDFDASPFVDVNSDGVYNPYDGDYPDIYGDLQLWSIINDRQETSHNKYLPMKFDVQTFTYAYKDWYIDAPLTEVDPILNNTIFVRYKITNRSGGDFSDFYLGQWTDFDLGNFDDDYIGCDTLTHSYYAYNGDEFDDGLNGYGVNIPKQIVTFLETPKDESTNELGMTAFCIEGRGFSLTGDAYLPSHFYNYLSGKYRDGSDIIHNGEVVSYFYPGEPNDPEGWSECAQNTPPADRRGFGGSGPYSIAKNESVHFEFAMITVFPEDGVYDLCSPFPRDEVEHIRNRWKNNDLPKPPVIEPPLSPKDHTIAIQVFPNPVDDILYVEASNFETAFMRIIDINGKVIKDKIEAQNNFEIDTSILPEGIYFIQLTNEDFLMHQRKVVVLR